MGEHKKAACKSCGKVRAIRREGKCYNCVAKEQRDKPKDAPPKSDKTEKLLDTLFGGPEIKSAPDETQLPKKEDKAKSEPKKPTGIPIIRPQLFLFIGAKLADLLDTEEFKLDKDSADYLADTCAAMLQEHGADMSPTLQFVIAMAMWLGMAFIAFAMKKYASTDKERGEETIWEKIKAKLQPPPEREKQTPLPMPPPVAANPPPPATEQPPQRQAEQADPKWRPIDLQAMMKKSKTEMLKNPSAPA